MPAVRSILLRSIPLPAALLLVALATLLAPGGRLLAAGPPFPDPVAGQRVYDPADAIRPETEAALETQIAEIERRTGAQVVVYLQVKPGISEDDNLADARALMDQWGIGRKGFDDGLVILFGLDETREHGRISLFGGAGFLNAYVNEDGLKEIVDQQMVPAARAGDIDRALLNAMDTLQGRITTTGGQRLETYRQVNAVLGLIVAPLAFLGLLAAAFLAWRREGDDPDYLDSPSVLMAGPPADMTPPLATVVRNGRADQHSLDTTLMELASRGYIAFENLDQVRKVRSDSDPNPLTDPAIVVNPDPTDDRPLAMPQQRALSILRGQAGPDNRLTRNSLWSLNDRLGQIKGVLDGEALRLGWFSHLPGPAITHWTRMGGLEVVLGLVVGFFGLTLPMSGATLLGAALALAGLATIGFGLAMSKRTQNGAIVDAMLKAYRRTLHKTLEQARSMTEVVADDTVRLLADTPDKAVVWGFALGLQRDVAEVLTRGLEDARDGRRSSPAYYPYWMSSSSGSGGVAFAGQPGGSIADGSGSLFSGSGMPDFGSMFSALGSVGSTPPSSQSSGGFGGGGSSGGGGASGSF
jgi:uncharacterized membrane protein YgcG